MEEDMDVEEETNEGQVTSMWIIIIFPSLSLNPMMYALEVFDNLH